MRLILLTTALLLGAVQTALAQEASRFELGPLWRHDTVFVEGGASGGTVVAGVVTRFSISRSYGLEGDLTWAANRFERSYEGRFISYADGPNATRDEIERLAPVARRSLGYQPGVGWSAAFVARGNITTRVGVAARAGLSARRYLETSQYTILSIPEGVDPIRVARDFENSSRKRTRGGLLFGFDVSLAVTDHLRLVPDIRFVYGGPARLGNKHRELGLGARAVWQFK
jgi:hypothetical protein